MEHIVHLLENAASQIYSQATPRNIVRAAHERWEVFMPAYDVQLVTVYLHKFRPSQVRLNFPSEVAVSLLLRLPLLGDGEISPDAPLIEQSDVR